MGIGRGELVDRLYVQTEQLRIGADEPFAIDQRSVFEELESIRSDLEGDNLDDIHPRDPFLNKMDLLAEAYQDELIYMAWIGRGNFSHDALNMQYDRRPFRVARHLGRIGLDTERLWQTSIVAAGETAIGRRNPLLYMARVMRAESQTTHLAPYTQHEQGRHKYKKPENPAHVHLRELQDTMLGEEAFRRLTKSRPDTLF